MTEREWIEAAVQPLRNALAMRVGGHIGDAELVCVMSGVAEGLRMPPRGVQSEFAESAAEWARSIDDAVAALMKTEDASA